MKIKLILTRNPFMSQSIMQQGVQNELAVEIIK